MIYFLASYWHLHGDLQQSLLSLRAPAIQYRFDPVAFQVRMLSTPTQLLLSTVLPSTATSPECPTFGIMGDSPFSTTIINHQQCTEGTLPCTSIQKHKRSTKLQDTMF
jgi:hypothetical protein